MKAPTRQKQASMTPVRTPRKPKPLPEGEPRMELCVNCANRTGCTLMSHGAAPVLQCEEYVCEGPGCADAAKPATPASSAAAKSAAPEPAGLVGLCVNCDHRFSCAFTRPPGGVWHCQEYQ